MSDNSEEIKSFFMECFKNKVAAYARGEPSAYLNQKVMPAAVVTSNSTDKPLEAQLSQEIFASQKFEEHIENKESTKSTKVKPVNPYSHIKPLNTYFQKWISKAYNHNTSGGIDITRMFDEIDLTKELLAKKTSSDKSEYDLALEDSINGRMEQRIQHVTVEAAKVFLNESKDELNDFAQSILNSALDVEGKPLSTNYEVLVDAFNPKDPNKSDAENLKIGREKLAYEFIRAIRACYFQKLQDLALAKCEIQGWDIQLQEGEELPNAKSLKKLPVIFKLLKPNELKDDDKYEYHFYGDIKSKKYPIEIVKSPILNNIDFGKVKTLASNSKNIDFYTYLIKNNLHSRFTENSSNFKKINKYLTFNEDVIANNETYNRMEINKDYCNGLQQDKKNSEELYEKVRLLFKSCEILKDLISVDVFSLDDNESITIEAIDKGLQGFLDKKEEIDFSLNSKMNVDEKMQEFIRDYEASYQKLFCDPIIKKFLDLQKKQVSSELNKVYEILSKKILYIDGLYFNSNPEKMIELQNSLVTEIKEIAKYEVNLANSDTKVAIQSYIEIKKKLSTKEEMAQSKNDWFSFFSFKNLYKCLFGKSSSKSENNPHDNKSSNPKGPGSTN